MSKGQPVRIPSTIPETSIQILPSSTPTRKSNGVEFIGITNHKNPVPSKNRVFLYSIALNQLYNYLAGVPPKLLFVGS